MYGTPITPSPPKSASKRGFEETLDASITKRQRSGVDDSGAIASISTEHGATIIPSTAITHISSSRSKRPREDEEDDDAANTKRQRSGLVNEGEAASTSTVPSGTSDSAVTAPGQGPASTEEEEEEEDLYGALDDENAAN
ncbi:hypothetical protein MMC30_008692 [Trapelia coarctata]|nr:hypothetical protein [Trapelia coarctata]